MNLSRKALAGFLGLSGLVFAADPFAGTWKLNVSKSKTTNREETVVIADQGNPCGHPDRDYGRR